MTAFFIAILRKRYCFTQTNCIYLLARLDNIALRSPGSTVIVVGTHLDCISSQKHGPNFVPYLNHLVRMLVDKPRYKCKVIVPPDCICAVSCAFGGSRTGNERMIASNM